MSKTITIREGWHGRYCDVLDAAKYHAPKHGGAANALACMARESNLFAEWVESNGDSAPQPTRPLPPEPV